MSNEGEDHEGEHEKGRETVILIAPNGDEHVEAIHDSETVETLLKKAVAYFSKHKIVEPSVEYILVVNGVPLDNSLTLEQVHVEAGAKVKIRSKAPPVDGCIQFCIPS